MIFDKTRYKFRIVELEDASFTYQYTPVKGDQFATLSRASFAEPAWSISVDRFGSVDEVKKHLSNNFVKRVVEEI